MDGVTAFLAREREELRDFGEEMNFHSEKELESDVYTNNYVPEGNTEEPECIKRWAESFQKRIESKDAAELKRRAELEEQAMKDLNSWAVHYRDSLSRGQKISRDHDKDLRLAQEKAAAASASLSNADATQAALWERVGQLCNFVSQGIDENGNIQPAATNSKESVRDLNRMRVLLLQLKQNPPVIRYYNRNH